LSCHDFVGNLGSASVIGIDLVVSWGLARQLRRLLFGIAPTDPATFVCAVLLLTTVALLASYVPARRVARIDPMRALRYE